MQVDTPFFLSFFYLYIPLIYASFSFFLSFTYYLYHFPIVHIFSLFICSFIFLFLPFTPIKYYIWFYLHFFQISNPLNYITELCHIFIPFIYNSLLLYNIILSLSYVFYRSPTQINAPSHLSLPFTIHKISNTP